MSFKNIFQEIHQDDDELNFEGVQEKQTNKQTPVKPNTMVDKIHDLEKYFPDIFK